MDNSTDCFKKGMERMKLNEHQRVLKHAARRAACLLALLVLPILAAAQPEATVYMIGDSTMANKPGTAAENPERGWGQNFGQFFEKTIKVDNHSMNGRSSKSFRDEGLWAPIEQNLKQGDFVIIQFGHNDEKTDAARHTDPATTFKENLARYVSETQAKGAHPILATPIARRVFDKAGLLTDTHGEFTSATRQVARELKVTLLDLNKATDALLRELGPAASLRLYLHFGPGVFALYPEGRSDNTHLSDFGATLIGKLAAEQLRATRDPLAKYLKADAAPQPAAKAEKLYHEKYRPQFHFTARKNWLNDPNGLVYYGGIYHMFFQYNPYALKGGPKHWGHATSPDLVHWTEGPIGLAPDNNGTNFSGSAAVDWKNTTSFKKGEAAPLVALYTAAPDKGTLGAKEFSQCLAYSADAGKSWTQYEKNPVLGHVAGSNRDPRILWHEPTSQWIMALYLEKNDFAFYGSKDLKAWTELSRLTVQGSGECPELFEMPVLGESARPTGEKKWIFYAGNARYLVGSFDGTRFTSETQTLRQDWGKNFYASQTWSDIPAADGRRIQLAWMAKAEYPGMPFNQQMSFPCELRLVRTKDGIHLTRQPVREIELLHGTSRIKWDGVTLAEGTTPELLGGDLFDVEAEFDMQKATEVGLIVNGEKVAYSATEGKVKALGAAAPLEIMKGHVTLRVLVDKTSIETFANGGEVSLSSCYLPKDGAKGLAIYAEGGAAKLVRLEAHVLRSAWSDQETYESAMRSFEKQDAKRTPSSDEVVFIGSSTFTIWKSLTEDMKPVPAVNRGFGGSQMMHAALYADRVVIPYKPKTVVVYEGGNDLTSGKSPEEVLADTKVFVERIHRALPQTKIYFIPIRPSVSREYLVDAERRTNELVKAYVATDPLLAVIDANPAMYDERGLLFRDIFIKDNLHMNRKGYELFFPVIKQRLMKDLGIKAEAGTK